MSLEKVIAEGTSQIKQYYTHVKRHVDVYTLEVVHRDPGCQFCTGVRE